VAQHATEGLTALARDARQRLEEEAEEYQAGTEDDRPLAGYAGLLGVYLTFVGVLSGIVRWRRAPVPERIDPRDLALLTVATHKVARIVTKDPVTSPVRALFTRFEGPSGEGEIHESVRGTGMRHAVGELLTCPFCIGQWIATAFVFGIVLAPRLTRLAASTFAMLAGSDLLQLAYARAQELLD
jgi:hypothetical protein